MPHRLEARAVVIGAGIVGLAIAEKLSHQLNGIVILERNARFGLETTARNSEVVHGGLYYQQGSLKARLCIEGAAEIFSRCERLGIPLVARGKLVVATTPDQVDALETLYNNARACGARDLSIWETAQLKRAEPRIPAVLAVHSPHTAVVDSHELTRSYATFAQNAGVDLAYKHEVVGLEKSGDFWLCTARDPSGDLIELKTPLVVNAAGHGSAKIAATAGIDIDEAGYRLHPSKGDYFSLSGRSSRGLERLIYPLPDSNVQSLGVHLTVDVGGQARLGPDATFIDDELCESSYRVDEGKLTAFLDAGRRLLPWLEAEDLSPERSGVRPKLSGPGEPQRDFVIAHESNRDCEGLINLIGIDSPGLTSSSAIAKEVLRIAEGDGIL